VGEGSNIKRRKMEEGRGKREAKDKKEEGRREQY
jgi:hypothetical protein